MNKDDSISVKGILSVVLTDKEGKLKSSFTKENLIVNVGKYFLTACLNGGATTTFNYMAVGTSGTAPSVGDTTLGAEIARVATTNSVLNNVFTVQGVFGPGVATGALQEAGILNAASVGSMLSHTTYNTINKGASDTLTITWAITVG